MATVIKRGKKAKVYTGVYYDHAGKQVWVKLYSDKGESVRAVQKLEEEARKIKLGLVDPQAEARRSELSKPIGTHIAEYKAKLQAAGRHENHIAYTIADVEALVDFASSAPDGKPATALKSAAEITWPLIDRWVLHQKHLQDKGERGHANKTINRRVSSVQQFLRHLAEIGGVTKYVLNRYPKLPTGEHHQKRKVRALTAEEMAVLLTDAQNPRHDLWTFASKTGLRRNECRQIVPAYLDFEHATIRIPAHVAKAKRDQIVPMPDSLKDMLKRRCEGIDAAAPILTVRSKQAELRAIREACKTLKIDTAGVGFHTLRHTFCTLLARKNIHPALLQKLARHQDLKTTLRYYVHLQRDDERAALNLL